MSTRISAAVVCLLMLAACSEPSQEMRTGHDSQGEPEYKGTGSEFVAPGWKQGDQASWTSEMKARTQRGQNEYNKIN